MRSLFKKSMAALLSLLVLFATTAISASTHYCGKYLVSFEINKTSKSCFSKYTKKTDDRSQSSVAKKTCCKDLSILKKGSNDILKLKSDVSLQKHKLLDIAFYKLVSFETLFISFLDKNDRSDYLHQDLQRIEDKTVLFQVFLI